MEEDQEFTMDRLEGIKALMPKIWGYYGKGYSVEWTIKPKNPGSTDAGDYFFLEIKKIGGNRKWVEDCYGYAETMEKLERLLIDLDRNSKKEGWLGRNMPLPPPGEKEYYFDGENFFCRDV